MICTRCARRTLVSVSVRGVPMMRCTACGHEQPAPKMRGARLRDGMREVLNTIAGEVET
jgi:hypothetical protein